MGREADLSLCRVFNKTNDYLDIFARFKAKENIEAVEQLLASKTELQYFERAQLGMRSCPTNYGTQRC